MRRWIDERMDFALEYVLAAEAEKRQDQMYNSLLLCPTNKDNKIVSKDNTQL